ncbi:3-phosphoshikimate 1-carboxyvinyltransferase [Anaeromyxobacter sp. Fw109-5]|uniref:3-phosphoshikimate 1-carboxyvinyltransferase n=1 Tax=Anaeromyxobacter sp. (strain Fw109-5) TaxID=404589 RepID=AROA_ANADF|nr:3-phosphoshikimate 1-carboxyvinyltransferase [Anaeromyxobacter sp. Fw109-5]A7H6S6.1 RecName: Full=3-phosphoshikimate 1-carboxyvinyltransferase; AltName: Full=5-enolpyruvylshikimate-3-phosphate synthase; Short=EPSP synthase; Short=EPSPS [Anaeromyxobacter sp. Fw109-5]ABS24422.1 3-phosphoshikimate 1-carboxyvinyltransferase [Anaeromyxobacter sp. Fw109-5]
MTGSLTCRRKGPLRGSIEVPGDKSISHRALLFGALSTGETRVRGLLDAEDVHATRRAVEALGATVRAEGEELVVVPPPALREPGDVVDCGNSGTSLRLLTGVLSGVPGLSILTGDASLRRRPVRRVIEPLRRMGADLSARDGDRLPPVVVRGRPLRGARHVLEVASAQVKSACLLAGLFAEGETTVVEPERSRDHTERMLAGMGVPVRVDGLEVTVAPARPRGGRVDVPGDISSAAFFLCAAAALPGSEVTVRNLGVNPTRTGLLDVLGAMGAALSRANEREVAGEPRADVTVRAAALHGTEIGGAIIPRLIDELPVVMVMATQARGRTVIRDAKELRVKESDRLASMGEALARAGAKIELFEDGCAIEGPTPLRGVAVQTRLDHRIAMSMAVAQLLAGGEEVVLDDVACVATSFPSFFALLDGLCEGGA